MTPDHQDSPSVCFVVQGPRRPSFDNQTVRDHQVLVNVDEETALLRSAAEHFLWLTGDRPLRPQAAEECLWALQAAEWVTWSDTGEAPPPSLRHCAGPLGVARRTMSNPERQRSGNVRRLPWPCRLERQPPASPPSNATAEVASSSRRAPGAGSRALGAPKTDSRAPLAHPWWQVVARVYAHLENAQWLSGSAWRQQPFATAARLLPLCFKEAVNHWLGRPLFDLRFYLQFQPGSVLLDGKLLPHLTYTPPAPQPGRLRLGLVTPHLGPGGAERFLLEFARQCNRSQWEILLIATESTTKRWQRDWEDAVDHVYHLNLLLPRERNERFLYSLSMNWNLDVLLVSNAPAGYAVAPILRERQPSLRTVNILHGADDEAGIFSNAVDAEADLTFTVATSGVVQQRLLEMAVPESKIRLIRSGVDLDHFHPNRFRKGRLQKQLGLTVDNKILLYAGRLDPDRQTLLLPEIAVELAQQLTGAPFHVVVAGEGPERESLQSLVKTRSIEGQFTVLGHVKDVAELLADTALLIIPSEREALPQAALEALAMEVPVVGCRGRALEEVVTTSRGILVEPGSYVDSRLAAAARELLADDERRQAMGKAARSYVERNHSLQEARRQFQQLIAELEARG